MTAFDYPIRAHLDYSAPLQWNRRAKTSAAADAIDHLLALLLKSESRQRGRRKDDLRRLRAALEAMVLDLFVAAGTDRPYRAYSRAKADYIGARDHPDVTLAAVVAVAEFLHGHGWAEGTRGSFTRTSDGIGSSGSGYRSRLVASAKLVALLEGKFSLSDADVTAAPWANPIRLKGPAEKRGGRKPPLSFEPTPELTAMADRVLAANALRADCTITLDGEASREAVQDADGDPEDVVSVQDRSAVHLYRVFSNGSWLQGGRFYGGWWQRLGKKDRPRLLIDGEPTVELDYQACHLRLCYHIDGHPLPINADPYAIPGLDASLYRGAIKSLTLRLLGAGPRSRITKPDSLKALSRGKYEAFIRQLYAAHQPVARWFKGSHWSTLQNFDSQLADAILADLTAQGIPCLPVHDSFIVPESAEQALGRAMASAWRDVLGRESGVRAYTAITGWSSEEAKDRWQASLRSTPFGSTAHDPLSV